ncbi:unnamed protein product, partial [Ectocarpus sp. 8 AP-2014]
MIGAQQCPPAPSSLPTRLSLPLKRQKARVSSEIPLEKNITEYIRCAVHDTDTLVTPKKESWCRRHARSRIMTTALNKTLLESCRGLARSREASCVANKILNHWCLCPSLGRGATASQRLRQTRATKNGFPKERSKNAHRVCVCGGGVSAGLLSPLRHPP